MRMLFFVMNKTSTRRMNMKTENPAWATPAIVALAKLTRRHSFEFCRCDACLALRAALKGA